MKNLFNSEQFLLAFTGIVSVWYACSWIIRILKSPKPYQRRQYLYIALALIVIILGISTFFTKFTLNCLCGAYVGVSAFIKLYREYRATPQKRDMFYIVLDGGAWGLSCSGGFVIRPHWVSAFAMRQDIFILVVFHIVTVTLKYRLDRTFPRWSLS